MPAAGAAAAPALPLRGRRPARSTSWAFSAAAVTLMAGTIGVSAGAPSAAAATVTRTYTVTSTADDPNGTAGSTTCLTAAGACTLRAALQAADAGTGPAVIDFDIPGSGLQAIEPTTGLPPITVPVTIDGYTQPGSAPGTAAQPPTIDIALVGPAHTLPAPSAPYTGPGLVFGPGSSGSVLKGLSVSCFSSAGVVLQSDDDTVEGSFLGAVGPLPMPPPRPLLKLLYFPGNPIGVEIDHARGEVIGGPQPGDANYISRNGDGVVDDGGTGNLITGDVIGPEPTWSTSPGFGYSGNLSAGVHLENSSGDAISGNTVSNNSAYGIRVEGSAGTHVTGNLVGISPDRKSAMGNGLYDISVASSTGTVVGGASPSQRNVIAASGGDGVLVSGTAGQGATIQGNYIGTGPTGIPTGSYGSGWNSIEVSAPGTVVGGPDAGNVIFGSGQSFGAGPYADVNVNPTASGTVIMGNYIGLPADGRIQGLDAGLGIYSQAKDVQMGGTNAGDGNVVDTFLSSIQSYGQDAVIQGNLIGTDPTGTIGVASSQPSNAAIEVTGSGTLIGGDALQDPPVAGRRICLPGADPSGGCSPQLGPRNVVDNVGEYTGEGIAVGAATNGATLTGVRIMGNLVGTDISGSRALGLQECGVLVGDGAVGTQVGGSAPGEGNVVSASGIHGIQVGPTAGTGNPTVGTVIQGNLVGTDIAGTRDLPDQEGGIAILAGAARTLIGGPGAGAANVVSGSPVQVFLEGGSETTVEGNLLGTDITGIHPLSGSGLGVVVNTEASDATVEGNVVSGNSQGGILTQGGTGIHLVGNHIGTTAGGSPLPNGGYGVYLGVPTVVGSTAPGAGNTIADNNGPGVDVGPGVTGGTVRGNSISGNTGLGIELDPSVAPHAPAPSLGRPAWIGRRLSVTGHLSGAPSSTYQIDVYASPVPAGGGHAQGATYLGSTAVKTDGSGHATFALEVTPRSPWAPGVVTATATNPAGSTSQFSAGAPFGTDPWVLAPPTPIPPATTKPAPTEPTPAPKPVPAGGYLLTDSTGQVFGFGEATHGSLAGQHLSAPIVGLATDACTGGYWLAGSDGGVFAFDAPFDGSLGGTPLAAPIVGISAYTRYDSTGRPVACGYRLVASDGGVFAFDAPFHGSTGGMSLARPVVGMAADPVTGGYWLVASDGGVFAFDAPFHGSAGGMSLARPVTGMRADPAGTGYWLIGADGGVFSFGAAPFQGSVPTGSIPASGRVTG